MHVLRLGVIRGVLGQCNRSLVITKIHRGESKSSGIRLRPGKQSLSDFLILQGQ